jgi:hypothetical protein
VDKLENENAALQNDLNSGGRRAGTDMFTEIEEKRLRLESENYA